MLLSFQEEVEEGDDDNETESDIGVEGVMKEKREHRKKRDTRPDFADSTKEV